MSEPEKKKLSAKIGGGIRGLGGELKKVTWPTFSKVVAQTGVVIAVTLFFLVILMVMDVGLNELYKLLVKGLTESVVLPLKDSFNSTFSFSSALNLLPRLN